LVLANIAGRYLRDFVYHVYPIKTLCLTLRKRSHTDGDPKRHCVLHSGKLASDTVFIGGVRAIEMGTTQVAQAIISFILDQCMGGFCCISAV
jgi:hypothetical protein